MICSKWHKELNENGVGKCSVPMWQNGCPAGFCDAPAYGKPEPCETFTDSSGRRIRLDGRYDGYVPGLACFAHGGPKRPEKPTVKMKKGINIVFDGPPGPGSGRFVDVETDDGNSISVGKWIEMDNGVWALRIEEIPNLP